MTSKERVNLALDHKETDRIPFSLGMGVNLPVKKAMMPRLNAKSIREVDDYLKRLSDIVRVSPDYIGPSSRNYVKPDGRAVDIWGVERASFSYGEGSYDEIMHYPLAGIKDIKELDEYQWPSADWIDAGNIRDKIAALNGENEYAVRIENGNIYESSWYMRGFENMFMDLIANPELAWEIMTRVTDYYIAYFKKILNAAGDMIDIVFTADDIGSQQGLLMSLDMWEKMIKPHHTRLNKALHEYDIKIMYHSDGAIMEAVPGLMDMGIDVLEALQFDAEGMDPDTLKSKYGDKLCFHGGVSVQSTLPFGSADDVRQEVKERVRVMGKGGGYILAPSHAIQAGTPPENVFAFIDSAKI